MEKPSRPQYPFPIALADELRQQNPWWEGGPAPALPVFRRWPFQSLWQRLHAPIAPILQLRGPRQTGKSILQQQLVQHLLASGVSGKRIFRAQFDALQALAQIPEKDDPILRIADWFQYSVLQRTFNELAHAGQPVFLFLDEVQNVPNWSAQLKSLVDRATVRAMVTGSSALRIALGRDSLAGRIQPFEIGTLRLAEIAGLRGLGTLAPAQNENGWQDWLRPDFWQDLRESARRQQAALDAAFSAFSERGAYPFAHANPGVPWPEIAAQLNETVIRRVIEHDLRSGKQGRRRDKQLLEAVFRMACRYLGQSPSPATLFMEARITLRGDFTPQRIRHYLDYLDDSLLLRAIPPLEFRLKKRRGYPKLCLCDHSLRCAWLQESIPLAPALLDQQPHLTDLAGHVAESAAGYYLASLTGLEVAHLPAYQVEPEVDFVLSIGERRIPIEIKYRRVIDPLRDTFGLRFFMEKAANNAPFGLLVTREEAPSVVDPRVIALPLKSLLMVR